MKRTTLKILFTLFALHASVHFTDASSATANGEYFDSFRESNLRSATYHTFSSNNSVTSDATVRTRKTGSELYRPLTHWDMLHQMIAAQGFVWTGAIVPFLYPGIYTNTPPSVGYPSQTEALTYDDCVKKEVSLNFSPTAKPLSSAASYDTLKGIAKYCAQEFYGPYFDGKSYTTREEMIMALFALFEEGVVLPGEFDDEGAYHPDGFSFAFAGYKNVSPIAWYAPYLKRAKYIGMVPDENRWDVAKEVTDDEIYDFLGMYGSYRMEYMGDAQLKNMTILTSSSRYTISLGDDGSMTFVDTF